MRRSKPVFILIILLVLMFLFEYVPTTSYDYIADAKIIGINKQQKSDLGYPITYIDIDFVLSNRPQTLTIKLTDTELSRYNLKNIEVGNKVEYDFETKYIRPGIIFLLFNSDERLVIPFTKRIYTQKEIIRKVNI